MQNMLINREKIEKYIFLLSLLNIQSFFITFDIDRNILYELTSHSYSLSCKISNYFDCSFTAVVINHCKKFPSIRIKFYLYICNEIICIDI